MEHKGTKTIETNRFFLRKFCILAIVLVADGGIKELLMPACIAY